MTNDLHPGRVPVSYDALGDLVRTAILPAGRAGDPYLPLRPLSRHLALGADPADRHSAPRTPEPQKNLTAVPCRYPKGVEPYAPDINSGADYLRRNDRHILAEHIKHASMFEKHYSPLDFNDRSLCCINLSKKILL